MLTSRIRESGKRSESAVALIANYRERSIWQLRDFRRSAVTRSMP